MSISVYSRFILPPGEGILRRALFQGEDYNLAQDLVLSCFDSDSDLSMFLDYLEGVVGKNHELKLVRINEYAFSAGFVDIETKTNTYFLNSQG
jgi:hypothetical protein|tara:strand:- start:2347 stop:2625 length:279 start_codon:yes stop_codon:yes gene_type:complete